MSELKIKRLYLMVALMSQQHKFSFDAPEYRLEFHPELGLFSINDTYVPINQIKEIITEVEVKKSVEKFNPKVKR